MADTEKESGRRPQIWVQLDREQLAQLKELARATGRSAASIAGLWVERGLAGAYDSGPDATFTPADRLRLDELTAALAKLSPGARATLGVPEGAV